MAKYQRIWKRELDSNRCCKQNVPENLTESNIVTFFFIRSQMYEKQWNLIVHLRTQPEVMCWKDSAIYWSSWSLIHFVEHCRHVCRFSKIRPFLNMAQIIKSTVMSRFLLTKHALIWESFCMSLRHCRIKIWQSTKANSKWNFLLTTAIISFCSLISLQMFASCRIHSSLSYSKISALFRSYIYILFTQIYIAPHVFWRNSCFFSYMYNVDFLCCCYPVWMILLIVHLKDN